MGSFRRAFLGYRRAEVEAAIAARDARVGELEREMNSLSEMFVGREREIGSLQEALKEANDRHDRSLAALETVAMRLEEIHAQACGQATRIRMKALQDAVEINRRVKELETRIDAPAPASNGADPQQANGGPARSAQEIFEGMVEVEIGPLGDFSQLVGFEDAAGGIGATSEVSVRRFTQGRATLAMRFKHPVELLRELEERAPFEFKVRDTRADRIVLDVDG
jgi:hypothetical protein